MSLTTDRNDPDLHVVDENNMQKKYLVLSKEERAKGFVRPVRTKYVHQYMLDGSELPTVLTTLKGVGGCGALTVMGLALSETYARDPKFYGATYCVGCKDHFSVGPLGQFHWDGTNEKVGT